MGQHQKTASIWLSKESNSTSQIVYTTAWNEIVINQKNDFETHSD